MNQSSRIFDGLGRIMNEAAGVADGVRREVETVAKSQAQRIVADMELVKREDFDALRELVRVDLTVIVDPFGQQGQYGISVGEDNVEA